MLAYATNSEVLSFQKKGLFGAWPENPGTRGWEYPWCIYHSGVLHGGFKILDAGCGGSDFPFYLSSLGNEVCGVDVQGSSQGGQFGIDRTLKEKWGVPLDIRVEDIRKMSWEDNSFDRVFCISVLEHLENANEIARAIAEMRRVVKWGGLIIITIDFLLEGTILPRWDYRKDIIHSGMRLLDTHSKFITRGDILQNPDTLIRKRSCSYSNMPFTALGYILRKEGKTNINRLSLIAKYYKKIAISHSGIKYIHQLLDNRNRLNND